MAHKLDVSLGQFSEAGDKDVNQDFHGGIIPTGKELILKGIAVAIADGISTSSVSDIAAETAVKSFLTDYYCTSDAWTVKTSALKVISAANSWLFSQTKRNPISEDLNKGYVCTFSAMILKGHQAHLFHVGDSRIYRIAGDSLEQLSEDHRVVLSSVESYLGRALGMKPEVMVDYRIVDLTVGDIFILATDGVFDFISAQEMKQMAGSSSPCLDTAAADIVSTALANGSTDNLTIQILRIEDLPAQNATELMGQIDLLPPPTLPEAPALFEGYAIERSIHTSSRSHIFLAKEPITGTSVTLKMPSIDLRGESAYLKRFMMEEWIARRINSPHVLKAVPSFGPKKSLYLVNEYFDGQTLRQWMRDNPTPDLETVRDIVEQIAKGLRAFHRKEMLHQDLRPENIMISPSGTVKIIDFGSTSVAGVQEISPAYLDDDILGTILYTAPEYFLGYAGASNSDLFSLGVIAYEMLTGKLPYGTKVSHARTDKDLGKLSYRSSLNSGNPLPGWIDHALFKAVHLDMAKRYDTLSEFITDLRRPSANFKRQTAVPLIEKNPVRFWQGLCLFFALVSIFLLFIRG